LLSRRRTGESRPGAHTDSDTGIAAAQAHALPDADTAGDLSLMVDVDADPDGSGCRPYTCRHTAATHADAHRNARKNGDPDADTGADRAAAHEKTASAAGRDDQGGAQEVTLYRRRPCRTYSKSHAAHFTALHPAAAAGAGRAGGRKQRIFRARVGPPSRVNELIDPLIHLRQRVAAAVTAAFGDAGVATDSLVHRSAHADYQSDAAMALAQRLERKPRDIAAALVGRMACDSVLESAVVSGPGFINLTLRAEYLSDELARMIADERLGAGEPALQETVVIDYSSPNLAKEMHVGHLRSTLIGDALARTLEFLGHRVIRQNHIGDWGTPFGMLIEHMIDEDATGREATLGELSAFYRTARLKFESDPAFADRARRRVVLLQSGEPHTLSLWQRLIDSTLEHLAALYRVLDVTLDESHIAAESLYNRELPDVVSELMHLGVAQISQDAVCVFPPGFEGRDGLPLPVIVRKQDGGYGYAATDLAAIVHRLRRLRADRILYVVGAPQSQHLAMVFEVARLAGWIDDERTLQHVAFGSVLGPDKKMLKTRAGESVRLSALLDEAIERARRLVDEKSPDLTAGDRAAIARSVGIGAVKYADLVNDRIRDYVFDWNRMLSFEGNTAPYLMYAHARIQSILRKAGGSTEPGSPTPVQVTHPAERALALELLQFPGVVHRTAESLQPHRLCQHLFEVATSFTRFYGHCPVIKADEPLRSSRLALCNLTARVLSRGLSLLGIAAPDAM
jgi:arginyl-tRNA synthetase